MLRRQSSGDDPCSVPGVLEGVHSRRLERRLRGPAPLVHRAGRIAVQGNSADRRRALQLGAVH